MKLQKKLFLITCLLLVGLFGNTVLADKDYVLDYNTNEKEIIVTTKHAELHIAKDYLTEKEIYNISNKIEKGIRTLKDYLGKDNIKHDFKEMGKIKYYIQPGDKSSKAIRSSRSVQLYHVHLKQSPYIHETAHILLDENQIEIPDTWLTEGLTTYLNSKFAEYPPEIIGDKNKPNKLAKEIIQEDKYKTVLEEFPTRYYRNDDEKWVYYSLAGSFIDYIESRYGKEKVLELYQAKRKETTTISALEDDDKDNEPRSVKEIFGTSINELKEQWLTNMK